MSDFNEDRKRGHSKDMNELSDVLETVSDKVPRLIREVMGSLYSKDTGAAMGQSVGAYYRELVASGIPQDAALGPFFEAYLLPAESGCACHSVYGSKRCSSVIEAPLLLFD